MNRLLFPILCSGLIAAGPPATNKGAPPPPPKAEILTFPQMIGRSAEALGLMRRVLTESLQKLEEARSSKDVVKLDCVNQKLTQEKGLLRISEQADIALQEDVAKKEQMAAEHEFTKVTIAEQKVRTLRAEAEECIGQLAFRTDQNVSVEVETPNDLPNGDPTTSPPITLPATRSPPASPTQ